MRPSGPGLVTPFCSFPTVCDHVCLECSSFGNWSLPPISSVSTIKPLRPVHCLSSYPRALRHGSFHASFCASFSLSTFSSQVGDAVCQALKGLCQPVCSPRERAYQEYYSTSRGSGDGPCEASGWAPLPGTRCRGVNNWQHLICRSTTSIHPSIHPCLHHHYPTSPTTIPNGSVQQGLPASILPPPTTVPHGSFSSRGMDEWIDGWMDGWMERELHDINPTLVSNWAICLTTTTHPGLSRPLSARTQDRRRKTQARTQTATFRAKLSGGSACSFFCMRDFFHWTSEFHRRRGAGRLLVMAAAEGLFWRGI